MATPAVAWFEITGSDGPVLQRFYSELFDCAVQDAGEGSGYGLVQLGSQTLVPPTTLEQFSLTFAVFADPEGHIVGLAKGAIQ